MSGEAPAAGPPDADVKIDGNGTGDGGVPKNAASRTERTGSFVCVYSPTAGGGDSPNSSGRPDSALSSSKATADKRDAVDSYTPVITYGLRSIQGHRKEMEDEHKCISAGGEDPSTPSSKLRPSTDSASAEDLGTATPVPPPDVSFFGVYDGHGGNDAAVFLRRNLHQFVFKHSKLLADPVLAMNESIAQVESLFGAKAKEQQLDAGSTVAVCLMVGSQLIAANVGDSEIVLSRGGQPLVMSTIHNMNKNPAEEDRVKEAGGRVFQKRLGHPRFNPQFLNIAVTRSIGDLYFKDEFFTGGKPSGLVSDADSHTTTLTPEDKFLIMACDGLWDVVTYQESIDFVAEGIKASKSLDTIAEELTQLALTKGSYDNITVIVLSLVPKP